MILRHESDGDSGGGGDLSYLFESALMSTLSTNQTSLVNKSDIGLIIINEPVGDNMSHRLPYMWSPVSDTETAGMSTTTLIEECGGSGDPSDDNRSVESFLHATNMLLLVYPWVLMCTGTLTNAISFAVLTRPKLKKSSTFFYLACLCVIDLLSLYTFCINFICFYQLKVLIWVSSIKKSRGGDTWEKYPHNQISSSSDPSLTVIFISYSQWYSLYEMKRKSKIKMRI